MPSISLRRRKAKSTKLTRKFGTVPRTKRNLPEFPPNLLLIILLIVVVFLISGGLFNAVSGAPLMIQQGETALPFIPYDMNSQTVLESMLFAILLVLGISGGYLASRTLYSSTRKESSIFTILSIALLMIGVFGSYFLLEIKIPGIFL